jgi:hypothetical protein
VGRAGADFESSGIAKRVAASRVRTWEPCMGSYASFAVVEEECACPGLDSHPARRVCRGASIGEWGRSRTLGVAVAVAGRRGVSGAAYPVGSPD